MTRNHDALQVREQLLAAERTQQLVDNVKRRQLSVVQRPGAVSPRIRLSILAAPVRLGRSQRVLTGALRRRESWRYQQRRIEATCQKRRRGDGVELVDGISVSAVNDDQGAPERDVLDRQ